MADDNKPDGVTPPKGDGDNAETFKYNGKFKDEASLEKSYGEIAKHRGVDVPEGKKLVGDDGFFKTHDELSRAYSFLESTKPAKKAATPASTNNAPDGLKLGGSDGDAFDADVPELLTRAGLKKDDVAKYFTENGEVSDEHVAALRKVNRGIGKSLANTIAKGLVADALLREQQMKSIVADAATLAGGADKWKIMCETAKDYVPADELDDIQSRLLNPRQYKGAVRDLKEHYEAKYGKANGIVSGGSTGATATIQTAAELSDLMKRVRAGDESAMRVFRSMPVESITKFTKVG